MLQHRFNLLFKKNKHNSHYFLNMLILQKNNLKKKKKFFNIFCYYFSNLFLNLPKIIETNLNFKNNQSTREYWTNLDFENFNFKDYIYFYSNILYFKEDLNLYEVFNFTWLKHSIKYPFNFFEKPPVNIVIIKIKIFYYCSYPLLIKVYLNKSLSYYKNKTNLFQPNFMVKNLPLLNHNNLNYKILFFIFHNEIVFSFKKSFYLNSELIPENIVISEKILIKKKFFNINKKKKNYKNIFDKLNVLNSLLRSNISIILNFSFNVKKNFFYITLICWSTYCSFVKTKLKFILNSNNHFLNFFKDFLIQNLKFLILKKENLNFINNFFNLRLISDFKELNSLQYYNTSHTVIIDEYIKYNEGLFFGYFNNNFFFNINSTVTWYENHSWLFFKILNNFSESILDTYSINYLNLSSIKFFKKKKTILKYKKIIENLEYYFLVLQKPYRFLEIFNKIFIKFKSNFSFFLIKNKFFINHKKKISDSLAFFYVKKGKQNNIGFKYLKIFFRYKKKLYFNYKVIFFIKYVLYSQKNYVDLYINYVFKKFNSNIKNKILKNDKLNFNLGINSKNLKRYFY